MEKKKFKMGLLIFAAFLPIVVQALFNLKPVVEKNSFYLMFWMLANYLFIGALIDMLVGYLAILSLRGLKINRSIYYLNLFIYTVFLIFVNTYFIQFIYVRDNAIINSIASVPTALIILTCFVVNLLSAAFPTKKDLDSSIVYKISKSNPIKFGKDKFSTAIGSFDEGMVFGNIIVFYKDLKSIYTDKDKELVIKGKGFSKNYLISIDTPKSRAKAIEIIKMARDLGKIEKKKVNL
ncbi:hypothetical protein [Peptoniphilus catoniae]|uniref:hypothetical protein n=1 Tax=Peptoniphilus catoniae TaxID=1660341 RepID=UPI0010FDDF0A|nr:hypothetical protein [Peptoniphilus catoniae]